MAEKKTTYTLHITVFLKEEGSWDTMGGGNVEIPVGEVLSFAPAGPVVEAVRAVAAQLAIASGDSVLRKLLSAATVEEPTKKGDEVTPKKDDADGQVPF